MSSAWFTSDHHFFHTNIIGYCERPFVDIDHMNAVLALNWRTKILPDDQVWLLGDIAMGHLDTSMAFIDSLPGHKHLIVGNHDRCFAGKGNAAKVERETARYLEVFETVRSSHEITVGDRDVRLCHFPVTGESRPGHPDRYSGMRLDDDGGWLICGHVHNAWKVKGRQINVGVDVWEYSPVSEAELVAIMDLAEPRL